MRAHSDAKSTDEPYKKLASNGSHQRAFALAISQSMPHRIAISDSNEAFQMEPKMPISLSFWQITMQEENI